MRWEGKKWRHLTELKAGLPKIDEILDNIRIGDNVVWQVTEIEEFRYFAEIFTGQAVKDGRNIIYIRFAQHEPVLKDLTGVTVKEFNPDDGFEAFTVGIHEEITRQGREAFYVFDCLSELQSVWYTDLMMGNFFSGDLSLSLYHGYGGVFSAASGTTLF